MGAVGGHRHEARHVADVGFQIGVADRHVGRFDRLRVEVRVGGDHLRDLLRVLAIEAGRDAALVSERDHRGDVGAGSHEVGIPDVGASLQDVEPQRLDGDGRLLAEDVRSLLEHRVSVRVLDHVRDRHVVAVLGESDGVVLIAQERARGRHAFDQRRRGHRDEVGRARPVGATAIGTRRAGRARQEVTAELGGQGGVRGQGIDLTELLQMEVGHRTLEHANHRVGGDGRGDVAIGRNSCHLSMLLLAQRTSLANSANAPSKSSGPVC